LIPDEVIEQVRARADILEVVGEVVKLKRAGASYKGLCPFHGEKTPSFTVNTHQGTYHCFGCQAHGDSLKFIRETQHLNFPESVRALAARVGVEVPETRSISPQQRQARAKKRALEDRLFDAQEKLTAWYEQCLARASVAQQYLKQRHISTESAREFRLGWAMNDVGATTRWMHQNEVTLQELEQLGVVIPYDPESSYKRGDTRLNGGRLRFRDRLMCPIFDLRDRVVGFSGRVIDPNQKTAKYLNSPETPIFVKGDNVFGLKSARVAMTRSRHQDLILCEGNLDVISLWQAGFPNAVAAMGTAVTEAQTVVVKRLTRSVICVMDGDAAGEKAAFKSLPILLSQGLDVRGKLLPHGHDPDSFIKQHGAESFRVWLSDALPLIIVRLHTLLKEHPRDPIGQAKIAGELVELVRRVESKDQRPLFLDVIARELGVERRYLSDLLVRSDRETQDQRDEFASPHRNDAGQYQPAPQNRDQSPSNLVSSSHDQAYEQRPYSFKSKKSKYSKNKDLSNLPWWTQVSLERGAQRSRPRQFGARPTGEAQLKLTPAPEPPPHLSPKRPSVAQSNSDPMSTDRSDRHVALQGYERESVSFLFYHPQLLDQFLEADGGDLFRHKGVKAFLMSLKSERDQGIFVTGELYLKGALDQSLVATLRDCIAYPPPQEEKVSPERKLGELMKRLKRSQLQAHLLEVTQALRETTMRLSASQSNVHEDVSEFEQRREKLIERYQELQNHLSQLSSSPFPQSS
jgi:DNA primase